MNPFRIPLLLLLLYAGCAPGPRVERSWTDATLDALSLRARVAQLVAVPLNAPDATPERLAGWVRADSVGGVWVEGGSAPEVAAALGALQAAAPLPLLVAAEVDGGAGVAGATELPPARVLAALEGDVAEAAGEVTAREARAVGIHLGVVSLPELSPTPAEEPLPLRGEGARERWAEYLEGLRDGGLLAGVRILPREGAERRIRVSWWDRAALEAVHLPLVREVLEKADAALLPPVAIPALTGDDLPLALSPEAVHGVLRRDLGFGGVVAADLRAGSPLVRRYGEAEAAVRAVAAGADFLLGVSRPEEVVGAVVEAVRAGRIPPARVEEAARRVLAAKARAGLAEPRGAAPDTAPLPLRTPRALEVARGAAARLAAAEAEALRRPPAPVLEWADPEAAGMSAEALARVDRVIEEAIRDSVFPGAALAVGRRGKLVRLHGYGRMAREEGARPVRAAETLYDVASLTKVAATTAAVMALVDEGELELDAPVRRYLPRFRGEGKGAVTVRHLLTHTSGLPAGEWLFGQARSPERALELSLEARLLRPPGERMVYSDFGFILLGEIAERAAGEPLDRYLARRVYAPLGMSSTMFLPPRALRPHTAPATARESERPYPLRGTVHDANAFRLGGVAGHAGLFSTARDMAVFAQVLLGEGSYGRRHVFSPEVVRGFTRDQPHPGDRGLGWDKPARRSSAGSYFSERSFGHTGYTGTSLWIDPEKELFVVLLTNRTYDGATSREMLQVREAVHNAVAQSITDAPVQLRPGAVRPR